MLSLSLILNEQEELKNDFLSLQDVIENGYSRKILRILRYLKELEEQGRLERYGIASLEPIGHGQAGLILPSTEKGYVVKASFDENDLNRAREFMNSGNPHVANIRSVKILNVPEESPAAAKDRKLVLIQVEKLNQFDDKMGSFFNKLLYPLIDDLNDEFHQIQSKAKQKFSKRFQKAIHSYYKANKNRLSPEERRICRQMIRFMRSLHNDGYYFSDKQASQFLIDKRGKLKLVDFGSVEKM